MQLPVLLPLLAIVNLAIAQIPRTTGGSLTIPSSLPDQNFTPMSNTATGLQYCVNEGLGLPPCALVCVADAAPKAGCNDVLAFGCMCNEFEPLLALAEQCVVTSCGLALGLIVQSSVSAICDCVSSYPGAAATQTPGPQLYETTDSTGGLTTYSTGTVIPYGNAAGRTRNVGGVLGAFLGLVAAL